MYWMGIDNGVSGSIGVVDNEGNSWWFKTPTKSEQSYTKTKQNITRIDVIKLTDILSPFKEGKVFLERPLVNPKMFKATMSAIRALEATLNVIEVLQIPLEYVDSKEWQKDLLPSGMKGSSLLKKASKDIGIRLFPKFTEDITKHGDADGLLIAEHFKRINR